MTSSRKRSSSSAPRTPGPRRLLVIGGAVGAFGMVLVACLHAVARRLDPPAEAAGRAQRRCSTRSNATAARDAALAAVRADPNNGQAHLALARGNARARRRRSAPKARCSARSIAGFDAEARRNICAHALLLQGEGEKALAEADKADPQYRAYALRIRARALASLGKYARCARRSIRPIRIAPRDAALWTDLGRFR
jgi:hypothetical protein